jgi:hypothetical protein
MQIKYLLPKTTNFAITNSGAYGAPLAYNPLSSTVGLLLLSIVSTATATVTPTAASIIEIQGSVDDLEWFTLLSVPVSSLKVPVNGWDVGINFGSRNYTQVVQTMPRMRVVTSAALATGAGAATTYLRALILNG